MPIQRNGRTDRTVPSGPWWNWRTSAITTAARTAQSKKPPRNMKPGGRPPVDPAVTQK